MRAQREGTGAASATVSTAAAAPGAAPAAAGSPSTSPKGAAADDPLAHFQAQHHAALQRRQHLQDEEDGVGVEGGGGGDGAGGDANSNSVAGSAAGTPAKKLPPKVPERVEVSAAVLANKFLEACEKEVGERADQRACESIDGVMEVAQRGAWAHVLSGAPMHLVALRSKVGCCCVWVLSPINCTGAALGR